MKLYEVNLQIDALLQMLEPDPETGEIPSDEEEIITRIHDLAMKREDILQYLAKLALNLRAESAMLKAEENRLKQRRDLTDRREGRLIQILGRECGGETTDLGVATLSYRRTSHVEVTDEAKAVSWLKRHKFTEAFRVPAPSVYKAEVKKLLSAGQKIPGCTVVDDRSCSLK
jgi:hypothetical protein